MSENKGTSVIGDYYSRVDERNFEPQDNYKGVPIYAIKGLHERVGQLIDSIRTQLPGSSAIDLAAGGGAMSLRLKDMGFNVAAVDYYSEDSPVSRHDIPYHYCDLNGEFSRQLPSGLDLVVAIEIIEHLENPRNFIRNCRSMLREGGYLILTTPNIDSSKSKADFVRLGTFSMFSDVSYRTIGHITPIATWLLHKALMESALEVVQHETFGSEQYRLSSWPSMFLLQQISKLLGEKHDYGDGACHIIVARTGQ